MNTPQVSEAEREQRFARLQERLPNVWAAMKRNRPHESIVVVPADADVPDRCCKHRRNAYAGDRRVLDMIVRHGLHFDHARPMGVVFHMLGAPSERGRVGMTAVADTPTNADATYQAERILIEESELVSGRLASL